LVKINWFGSSIVGSRNVLVLDIFFWNTKLLLCYTSRGATLIISEIEIDLAHCCEDVFIFVSLYVQVLYMNLT
jgi:hypothetical protein